MRQDKRWVRITHCENIPLREGREVQIAQHAIAIFNLGGRFLAVENCCPHKGGPLADGVVSGTTVVCPLHAWKFSLETGQGANALSASRCVRTFPVRVEDGVISIELLVNGDSDPRISQSCMAGKGVASSESTANAPI